MRSRTLYDVAALLARIGVGVVFIAHGWQKIEVGITLTAQSFERQDVPLPTGAAVYATFAELIGGTLMIAGLWLPAVGALLFVDMAGALVFVHAGNGLFLVNETGTDGRNGYELVVVLGVASLLLAFSDGGRLSLDHVLANRDGTLGGRAGGGLGRLRGRRSNDDDDEDVQRFVDSLREAEEAPVPEKPKKPARRKGGSKSAESPTGPPSGPGGATPALPEAAASAKGKSPSSTGRQARLAGDILSNTDPGTAGTEDDTLVAGRRKPASRRRRSDTQPMKRNQSGDGGS